MSEEYTEVELRREAMDIAVKSGADPEKLLDRAKQIYDFLVARPDAGRW